MTRKMLIAMSLLATFAVPALAGDVGAKSAPPLRITVPSFSPMQACDCCAPRISWKEEWIFVDTETDLPITQALGWDFLKEPREWECQNRPVRIDFDWSDPPEEEGFNGFVIAG